MLSRYVEKKVINIVTKKGNKFKSERLLKKSLKHLIKKNKKNVKHFIYFSINYLLVTFKLEKIKKFNMKTSLNKGKPTFILFSQNKVFFIIKEIFNFTQKKQSFLKNLKVKITNILQTNQDTSKNISNKVNEQKQILKNQNSLIFYRWKK